MVSENTRQKRSNDLWQYETFYVYKRCRWLQNNVRFTASKNALFSIQNKQIKKTGPSENRITENNLQFKPLIKIIVQMCFLK